MKYYISFAVEGRYIAGIEANSYYNAKKKAEQEFSNADFGELRDVDGEAIIVEDEDGNYVWEK